MLLINISLLSIFICITRGSYHELFAVDCTIEGDRYPMFVEPSYTRLGEYIVCKHEHPNKAHCPIGLFYDAVSEKCMKNFKIQNTGRLCRGHYHIHLSAFPANPTIYYLCFDSKIKFIFKCPKIRGNNQVFVENSCRLPCFNKNGNRPAASRQDFISCSGSPPYGSVQTCPKDTSFNPNLKRCSGVSPRALGLVSQLPEFHIAYTHDVGNLKRMDAAGWVRRDQNVSIILDCDHPDTIFPFFSRCEYFYQCKGREDKIWLALCTPIAQSLYHVRENKCQLPKSGIPKVSICAQNPCRKGRIEIARLPQQKSHFYLCDNGDVIYMARCDYDLFNHTWVLKQENSGATRCVIECNFTGLRSHPDPKYQVYSGFRCDKVGQPAQYIVCKPNQIFEPSEGGCVSR